MHFADWIVIAGFYLALGGTGWYTKRLVRGVADFLVAGRGMRKYLGFAAGDAADKGAASTVAAMEVMYRGGPAILFMGLFGMLWGLFIGVTGFIIHRYRETKIMTTPQLFEMRYSKGVRVTAGTICAMSGIVNMAIFPIVAGRFFTYFSGLPHQFYFIGITWPTVHVLTAFLVGTAIAFAFMGGQVSVVVTDFVQAIVMSFTFIALGFFMYRAVSWAPIAEAILQSDKSNEMLNPFATKGEFGLKYLALIIVAKMFATASWAPSMQKVSSAASPKDARMMMLLYNLRIFSSAGMTYAGLAAIAVMTLPQFADLGVAEAVSKLSVQEQAQMAAPFLLARVLPVGIMGLMFAGMMAAFISTNDSYLLTWAGIVIQDVIYPLRKKPLERRRHLWLLRITVLLIGIFVYLFGIFYQGTEAIVIFQQLTGAIYMTGAGTIIILGLYWRRGNYYGAYASLLIGSLLTMFKFFPILLSINSLGIPVAAVFVAFTVFFIWKSKFPALITIIAIAAGSYGTHFALKYLLGNLGALETAMVAYFAAFIAYIVVSLITPNPHFDLEKMLNRPPRDKK